MDSAERRLKALALHTVQRSSSIQDALVTIEANHHRCVIVVDQRNRVVGTLSDGDVRRALLDHRLISAPVEAVMNLNFISLRPGEEAKAAQLYKTHRIHVFPVVDEGNQLLDVVLVD